MKKSTNDVKKICSFYVSDLHLVTMILPHVNKMIKENIKLITILEDDLNEDLNKIISSMNLKEETKNEIYKISWTSNLKYKYCEMEKYIKENLKNNDKIEIIIKGTKDYIEIMNKNVIKALNKTTNKKISIVNCYEITQFNNISEVLEKHNLILNTAGINPINDIFTEYKNNAL